MSCGFHHAYCNPCQNRRACRIRRISCRRATIPSSRYCTTSSRSAFTRSGRNSSSRSLFGPSDSFASASCTLAAGCLPSIPTGARAATAPCADCAPSIGATNPSFGASVSPFKMAISFKLFVKLFMVFSSTDFSLWTFYSCLSLTRASAKDFPFALVPQPTRRLSLCHEDAARFPRPSPICDRTPTRTRRQTCSLDFSGG
jgi:hypothetical protein